MRPYVGLKFYVPGTGVFFEVTKMDGHAHYRSYDKDADSIYSIGDRFSDSYDQFEKD